MPFVIVANEVYGVSLDEVKAKPRETNLAWLDRVGARDGILFPGGASTSHFRIRVAQSQES